MSAPMPMQPDPDAADGTLVQREGVNAGSDRGTAESVGAPAPSAALADALGSVRSVEGGGRTPDPRTVTPGHGGGSGGGSAAERDRDRRTEDQHDRDAGDRLTGAPPATADTPGQYGAESGQDSGSIS